jgi:hypothetical protein
MGGHVVDRLEAAVVNLLDPAGVIEPNYLDQYRVFQVGNGGIIEGEVPILADAGTDDVGRLVEKQIFVGEAGSERPLDSLARNQVQAILAQIDEPEEMFLEVTAE